GRGEDSHPPVGRALMIRRPERRLRCLRSDPEASLTAVYVEVYYGFTGGNVSPGEPMTAILYLSARAIISSRSKISVLPAATERHVAPAAIICSTVGTPTTGTSKRISLPRVATVAT